MEARKDRIIRLVTIDEVTAKGKWIPSNSEGEEIDKENATHVACSHCGKAYKWNQSAWINKHEESHEEESSVDERTKVLNEAMVALEKITKRIEGVLREDERRKTG